MTPPYIKGEDPLKALFIILKCKRHLEMLGFLIDLNR